MTFRYFKFPLEKEHLFFGREILKPIIPIELLGNGRSVRYAALVDSGADFCIFDAEIGEALDIAVLSGPTIEFGGIQERGNAIAYIHPMQLKIGEDIYDTQAAFSYDIARHGYGVLGQRGFFEFFVVKFDLMNEEIEVVRK